MLIEHHYVKFANVGEFIQTNNFLVCTHNFHQCSTGGFHRALPVSDLLDDLIMSLDNGEN